MYPLDETGARCAAPVIIHEDTDEKATLAATLLLNDHDLDLWKGARRVATLRTGKSQGSDSEGTRSYSMRRLARLSVRSLLLSESKDGCRYSRRLIAATGRTFVVQLDEMPESLRRKFRPYLTRTGWRPRRHAWSGSRPSSHDPNNSCRHAATSSPLPRFGGKSTGDRRTCLDPIGISSK
jgi:hypothetical protein